jgi:hypothetical protein
MIFFTAGCTDICVKDNPAFSGLIYSTHTSLGLASGKADLGFACRDIVIPVGLTRCGITIHLCCASLAMDRLCPRYVDSHTHEPPCGLSLWVSKFPALPRTAPRPSILIPCLRKPLLTAPLRSGSGGYKRNCKNRHPSLASKLVAQAPSLSIPPPSRGRGARII